MSCQNWGSFFSGDKLWLQLVPAEDEILGKFRLLGAHCLFRKSFFLWEQEHPEVAPTPTPGQLLQGKAEPVEIGSRASPGQHPIQVTLALCESTCSGEQEVITAGICCW